MGVPLSRPENRQARYRDINVSDSELGVEPNDSDDGLFKLHNFEFKQSNECLAHLGHSARSGNNIRVYLPSHSADGSRPSDTWAITQREKSADDWDEVNLRLINVAPVPDNSRRLDSSPGPDSDEIVRETLSSNSVSSNYKLSVSDDKYSRESQCERSVGAGDGLEEPQCESDRYILGESGPGSELPTREQSFGGRYERRLSAKTSPSMSSFVQAWMRGTEGCEDEEPSTPGKHVSTLQTTGFGESMDASQQVELLPTERDYSSALAALMRKAKQPKPSPNLVHTRRERPRNHGRTWVDSSKAFFGIPQRKCHVIHVKPAEEQEEQDSEARLRYERSMSRIASSRDPCGDMTYTSGLCDSERGLRDWDREEINAALDPLEATLSQYVTGPTYVKNKLTEINSHAGRHKRMAEESGYEELEVAPDLDCFMDMEFGQLEPVRQRMKMPTFFRYARNYY